MNNPAPDQKRHPLQAGTVLSATLSALLLGFSLPAAAAPTEGTAGQTVSGRAVTGLSRPASKSDVRVAAAAPQPVSSKPAWRDLSPAQQQALQPLAPYWPRLRAERKRKWLVISKNYASLPPTEQAKLHRRMSEWATLSQQQRTQARVNFTEVKKLSAEQKAAQWEAYQALSAEEKRKLAAKARTAPAGVAAVKPAPATKMSPVPVRRQAVAPGARMAEVSYPVQPYTLLPRQEPLRTEPENIETESPPDEDQ